MPELSIEERSKLQADSNSIDLLGAFNPQGSAELNAHEQTIANAASFGDVTAASFRLAPFVTAYQWDARKEMSRDPNFNLEEHRKELTDGVPSLYFGEFSNVRSLAEGYQLRRDIMQRVQDESLIAHSGITGIAASLIPGLVDPINAVTNLFTFGAGGMIAGTARGAAAMATSQAVTEAFSPTQNREAVLEAGLTGIVFGAVVHANQGLYTAADKAKAEVRSNAGKDFSSHEEAPAFSESITPKEKPQPGTQQEATTPAKNTEGSVGAAQVYPTHIINDTIDLGGFAQELRSEARRFNYRNRLDDQFDAAFKKDSTASKSAKALYDTIQKTSILSSDWDRLWHSGSEIAKTLNYKMFESPAGLVVNNKSASMLRPQYHTRLTAPVIPLYEAALEDYLKSRGLGGRLINPESVKQFHRDIVLEMNARLHDGDTHVRSKDPHVVAVADALDVGNKAALEVMQGKAGEIAVKGSEELKFRTGWMRQIWDGEKIRKIVNEKPENRIAMEHALAQTYLRLHPALKLEDATIYARAVIRGAIARTTELDTNLVRVINQDGRSVAVQLLKDNGIDAAQAESIVDAIKGATPEAGMASSLRSRLDVDLRQALPGTNYTLLDMVDTNVPLTWQKYSRQISGLSSLARHDIQKQNIPDMIDSMFLELDAVGNPRHLTKQELQSMFSYFTGGAEGGGLSPWLRRALGITNLALLSANGLTQMAELGAQIGAVGWKAFIDTAPKEFKDMLAKRNTPAMESLAHILSPIRGENIIFGTHYGLEEISANAGAMKELGAMVDTAVSEGRKIQGLVNGFHFIKKFQERNAIRSILYRFAEHFKGENKFSPERMYSLGFTKKSLETRIGKYFTDGTILYDGKQVKDFQFQKWNPKDIDEFTSVLQRHVGTVVQQINAGEGSIFFNTDIGAVLSHLKKFPLVAMQKQLIRNTRIMDSQTVAIISYSLATAGIVFAARQMANGNTDKLNPKDIALGTISMGNMTGWIPMANDPIMSILGQDNLRFSQYGPTGANTGVISVPPVIPTFNRLAHIPQAVISTMMGNGTKADINALKATPIIGNAVGMSHVWNSMLALPEKKSNKSAPEPTPAPEPVQKQAPEQDAPAPEPVQESNILKDLDAQ